MRSHRTLFPAVLVLAAFVTACGGGGGSDASTTVEVSAIDELRFEPDAVTVEAGQEVTFVVTNDGAIEHEFLLGDEEAQMAAEGEGEHEEGHAGSEYEPLVLDPGETEEITVTFDEPGEILFGCHVPGHYEAGMVGTITVQ